MIKVGRVFKIVVALEISKLWSSSAEDGSGDNGKKKKKNKKKKKKKLTLGEQVR